MHAVEIFSGFNEKEIPTDSFMVIEVLGTSDDANLDNKNINKDYLILMKQNEDTIKFMSGVTNALLSYFYKIFCSLIALSQLLMHKAFLLLVLDKIGSNLT